MKKTFSFLIVQLLGMLISTAFAYDFSAQAPSGQTLYFNINPNTWTDVNTVTVTYPYYNSSYHNYYYQYNQPSGNLIIPSSVNYNGTTYTVKYIGETAFCNCTNLISVTIPNSVTNIDNGAFSGCTGLTSITIPNSVTNIGFDAFSGCTSLTSITIPNSVTNISMFAFYGCTGLTSITIPNSVTSIDYQAFYGCTGLTSITIPNSVTHIEHNAFENCTGLTSINIPNSVITIGCFAFRNCSGLTSVTIPNSEVSIGLEAFYGCSSLTSVTLPSSLSAIGIAAFSNCLNINSVFLNADSCIVSNNVAGCSTNSRNECAFYICISLTNVTIGSNVRYIDTNLFRGCLNISTVTVEWTNDLPNILHNPFNGVPLNNATLLVPTGTSELYNTTYPWNLFGNIQEDSLKTITVSSGNNDRGVVTGSGEFMVGDVDTLTATANYGYHFGHWSDNDTNNPRVMVCTKDSTIVGIFEPNDYTLTCNNGIGGGTYPYLSQVEIHALPQANMQFRGWSDNIFANPRTITIVSDTVLSAIFTRADTTYIHDTTTVYDSIYVDVYVHDTTIVTDTLTEYVPVHDTTYITLFDTVYVDVLVHDTTVVTDTVTLTEYVPVHDTTIVTDTVTLMQYDTITNTVFDTIDNYIYDTVTVTDTLRLTLYDTITIHDTIIIHDTIVVGVDEVEAINAKIFTRHGQIVVEGADGNDVWLYDMNGRIIATKQDYGMPIHFDVPVSGTYLIQIGAHPAHRVVVIR